MMTNYHHWLILFLGIASILLPYNNSLESSNSASLGEILEKTTDSINDRHNRTVTKEEDPYNEFAEPKRFLIPESSDKRRLNKIRQRVVKTVARIISNHKKRTRILPTHKRSKELDSADPYKEVATKAYYEFIKQLVRERNALGLGDLGDASSSVHEIIEGYSTVEPDVTTTPETTMTPSPPVRKCAPFMKLRKPKNCKRSGKSCTKDSQCPSLQKCCFNGCKLACTDKLVKHVCKDSKGETYYPGDLYMYKKDTFCICDYLGRPIRCKVKKPCIEKISSELYKIGVINDKTVNTRRLRGEPSRRQKLYSALNSAFNHINRVY